MDEQTSQTGESGHTRLGLPETGPGSVAGAGRRVVALFVDWLSSYLVVAVLMRGAQPGSGAFSLAVLALFAAEIWLLTTLTGASFGQRIVGLRVAGLGGRPVGPLRVLARTLLILLVIPAAVWDRDGRGLHDRVANSVVVNA